MSLRRWMPFAAVALLSCSNGVGDVCADNQPCVPALRCVFPTADAQLGVCDYPPRQFGERCSRGEECADDLTCSSHFTPSERYGTCIHRLEAGAGCVQDRDCLGGACSDGLCALP